MAKTMAIMAMASIMKAKMAAYQWQWRIENNRKWRKWRLMA
jgi:hypothetical protein